MLNVFFGKLVYCTNCNHSRIQKALDGFHSLPVNLNFELIDFWVCRRNIVFIVSDKFTRHIKLFFPEAWRSQKEWKKVSLNSVHYIGRYVFFWCSPLGHIILHWIHEKIVLFGSNFLMLNSSWAIRANFLLHFGMIMNTNERCHFALANVTHCVISMRMFKDCKHTNCLRVSFLALPDYDIQEEIYFASNKII